MHIHVQYHVFIFQVVFYPIPKPRQCAKTFSKLQNGDATPPTVSGGHCTAVSCGLLEKKLKRPCSMVGIWLTLFCNFFDCQNILRAEFVTYHKLWWFFLGSLWRLQRYQFQQGMGPLLCKTQDPHVLPRAVAWQFLVIPCISHHPRWYWQKCGNKATNGVCLGATRCEVHLEPSKSGTWCVWSVCN